MVKKEREREEGKVPRETSSSLMPRYASPTPRKVTEDEGLISK